MLDFRTFIEAFEQQPVAAANTAPGGSVDKPWKAKKADVINHWKNLTSNLPIKMDAVPEQHKGTRFRSDGLRITGSPQFINSVLSRIKDMADFEKSGDRLDVEYRQIQAKMSNDSELDFVFYCHLVQNDKKLKI
jgi:hypothetical protein